MIVYRALKSEFLDHTFKNDIQDVVRSAYLERTGRSVSPAELRSWKESLLCMAKTLNDSGIPDNAGVAIEYHIPQTGKRVDFIVAGRGADSSENVVMVELKQWTTARRTDKDAVVVTRYSGGEQEVSHPSYQAWSYAALLQGFNEAVYDGGVSLKPCAYLHNYLPDDAIDHVFYQSYIDRAPLFLAGESERERLRSYIKSHVRSGDYAELINRIEGGRIRPSKMLVDSLAGMIKGKEEFVLIDDQKVVFENVVAIARSTDASRKRVVIVHGGPGTGKSVLAINLLSTLAKHGLVSRYVSKNAAPRAVYESKLTGVLRRTEISNLFCGSGAFTEAEKNCFDVLIVDEAHRLNEKSGLYGNLGDNQIKEIIGAAKCSVFFVDDHQRVTLKDIGGSEEIQRWANRIEAQVTHLALVSQFRCNGSGDYLTWVDEALEVQAGGEGRRLDPTAFDFRVLGSPHEVHSLIAEKNKLSNKARVVAGYCWKWASKRAPDQFDVVIPEHDYRKRWNLSSDGSLWIVAPDSVDEVGCIHTSQGLEVDYIGVIVGPDLVVRNGRVVCRPEERASSDKSLGGYRRLLASDPGKAKVRADEVIKNTYRTLLTRGMKGCFIYCTDAETAEYFRQRLAPSTTVERKIGTPVAVVDVRPFRALANPPTTARFVTCVPVQSLRAAAGGFGDPAATAEPAEEWAEFHSRHQFRPGMFVAQVVGRSMEPRVPHGSWCLFSPIAGTRQGKTVLVELRDKTDPDTGERFTLKRYESEKRVDEDGWKHLRIVLHSTNREFPPIECRDDQELRVIGVLTEVLAR